MIDTERWIYELISGQLEPCDKEKRVTKKTKSVGDERSVMKKGVSSMVFI
jgi:hypothetical protein